jgi:hypothetical protein
MITGTHFTEWHYGDGRPPHRFTSRITLIQLDGRWKTMILQADIGKEDFETFSLDFVTAQAAMLGHIGARR